jgi:hypothetical protein
VQATKAATGRVFFVRVFVEKKPQTVLRQKICATWQFSRVHGQRRTFARPS